MEVHQEASCRTYVSALHLKHTGVKGLFSTGHTLSDLSPFDRPDYDLRPQLKPFPVILKRQVYCEKITCVGLIYERC